MSEKNKAIIVDLDGTLCNTEHRQHYMNKDKKDWIGFYSEIPFDKPNHWCVELIKHMSKSYYIIFVTGRPLDYEDTTSKWLQKNGFGTFMICHRKSGDYRKDSIVKEEIYKNHIEERFDVLFCVDDRQQVVDMWRSLGLTCLQCAKGDF
jgi:hydroxymethylpyrimidine pyrophosphatase-like HAD family hydrolase